MVRSAIWLASNGPIYIAPPDDLSTNNWGNIATITSLAISLTVNAVVTGLIVFRLLQVSRMLGLTFGHRTSCVGRTEAKFWSIVFVMIESGMAMFAIQLIRVVLSILNVDIFKIIIGINQMFNVTIRSVILLFTSLKLILGDNTDHHLCTSVNGIILS